MNGNRVRGEVCVVVAIKSPGRERYTIIYNDSTKREAIQQAARWAMNKELSLRWVDCLEMQRKIRES